MPGLAPDPQRTAPRPRSPRHRALQPRPAAWQPRPSTAVRERCGPPSPAADQRIRHRDRLGGLIQNTRPPQHDDRILAPPRASPVGHMFAERTQEEYLGACSGEVTEPARNARCLDEEPGLL